MKRYNDVVVYNMLRDLAPNAEIKMIREYKGMRTDRSKAVFFIDGRLSWTKLSELDKLHHKYGHNGVMDDLAKFLQGILRSEIRTGIYDSSSLREEKVRRQGNAAEMLEFAMKSAGSSDEEIYRALKDV